MTGANTIATEKSGLANLFCALKDIHDHYHPMMGVFTPAVSLEDQHARAWLNPWITQSDNHSVVAFPSFWT